MLPASHLISHGVPGHGPSMVSPCPSCKDSRNFPLVNVLPSRYTSKSTLSFICNANSSGQRRNPDFSRQNRQAFTRNKNRNNTEENRDSIDGFDDSEPFTSKNAPSFLSNSNSTSPPPKFHSAATPGPREREIVEIFRKVQAQLRERAAQKEEKKVEDSQSQGHNKQNETVDSLLKLLRKHSVQHGKSTTNSRNNKDFVLDNNNHTDNYNNNNSFLEEIKKDVTSEVQSFRPVSNFQKRSPVPRFKYKPILTGQEVEEDVSGPDPVPEIKLENGSVAKVENEVVFGEFDESCDDESEGSEIEEVEDDRGVIENSDLRGVIENSDLSGMKLVELRALAKARGIKGMSRLKKQELLDLLSS